MGLLKPSSVHFTFSRFAFWHISIPIVGLSCGRLMSLSNHRPPCLIFTLFYSHSLVGPFYPSSYLLLPSFYPKAYHYGRGKKEEGRRKKRGLKYEGLRLSFYLPALSSASSFLHRATSIFTSSSLRRKKEDVRRKSYFPPNSWSSFLQRVTRILTNSSQSE